MEGQLKFISRDVKASEVMPFVPLSVVARLNNQARKEMLSKKLDIFDTVVIDELRELTGYEDDLPLDTPIDLLSRDSRTISLEHKAASEAS